MVNNSQGDTGRENQALGEFCTAAPWCVPFITAWIQSLDLTQELAMKHEILTHKLLFDFSHRELEQGLFVLEKRRFLGESK